MQKPKILAISGFKNSGKTTLIARILPLLCDKGIKVATIKHDGHEFKSDIEGTDTHRHMEAGALGTAIFSKNKYMIVNQVATDETELFKAFDYADLIILEGFKHSHYPKIEIIRNGAAPEFQNVIAVVSESKESNYIHKDNLEREDCNYIHRDDLDRIVEVICRYIEGENANG